MSSRAENKTASQFVSLTLKIKCKLRPERPKPSQQLTVSTPELKLQQRLQSSGVLVDEQRDVLTSLQYFKALVDKLGMDKPRMDKPVLDPTVVGHLLGGASSGVLEAIQTLVQLETHLRDSKTIHACLSRLYCSLAQLISWADHVVLCSITHGNGQSTESVTTVIRAVLDNVKELVRLAAERQRGSTPLSPVQSQSLGFDDQETEGLSTCRSSAEEEEDGKEGEKSLAPPKPPMPIFLMTPQQEASPPALPPKRRQSAAGLAPCSVAIVTPMRRESVMEAQESDDGWMEKNTSCEDDPDYDFLNTDLSFSQNLPPLPPHSRPPPTLPEKRRQNMAGLTSSQAPPFIGFGPTPLDQSSTHIDDITGPDDAGSSPLSPTKTPPPLPEKKHHIHQYLQLCSSYSDGQSPVSFYQRPPAFRIANRHGELDSAHLDTTSARSPEPLPVPLLPPKKKQQDSAENQTSETGSEDSSQSVQQKAENGRRSSQEEQEEFLLRDHEEILHRITMKSEEEEGPDVKAASPDVLLVYATESSTITEDDLFCEAFLCTYRSFISPSDIISKLQHRYRHLQDRGDVKASRNTFHLLARVVDELSVIELEYDLLLLLMDVVFNLLNGGELGPAHQLHSNILSKMEKRWQLIGSPQSLRPLAAKGVSARPGTLLDFRSQDLAEQLTLMDSVLFCKIELPEVLLWSKEQNEEKSPNLTEFTQHFNNVSFWVRSVIIVQDKAQDRERLLLKFLKIMKHLRKLNNFNSYLSILSALDSAPLRRLDWQKSTSEALEEFSSLIDSSSSFRVYRTALNEVEPPCIPYLGLILQDLTFVHLGNPDMAKTPHGPIVNFSKRWQQFNILETVRSYQQAPYSLQPDDDIISFFNDFSDHLAEEALWELSLRIRPKNAPRTNQR
ncbi:rap guanine nucleotide exchange factor 1 [Pholidichthys leucotaenia]